MSGPVLLPKTRPSELVIATNTRIVRLTKIRTAQIHKGSDGSMHLNVHCDDLDTAVHFGDADALSVFALIKEHMSIPAA